MEKFIEKVLAAAAVVVFLAWVIIICALPFAMAKWCWYWIVM